MSNPRLKWYAAVIVIVLAAGYGLAIVGLALCSPPPLTGDAAWVWTARLRTAIAVVFGQQEECYLPVAAGRLSLAVAASAGFVATVVAVIAVAWELIGRPVRRALWRSTGGHAILAGEPGEIEALAVALGRASPAFVARDSGTARAIGGARPFSDVTILGDRRDARRQIDRLGGPTASFIAAATDNDLTNGELAEAALAEDGMGEVLVRLEQSSVRGLKSDVLRRTAEGRKRRLTVISLHQIQARHALQLAMPGRFVRPGVPRIHIALVGAGTTMQDAAFMIARQGYGLEDCAPLLSVMRTGGRDFTAGALERLIAADAIDVHPIAVDGDSAVDIERSFSGIALSPTPLTAVHCCEEDEGAALALALRLERVLVDLDLAVPPIVVHGGGPDEPGETGMIRLARALTLAEARTHAALIDRRAMAFHAAYLDGQRKARGDAFGTLPAELDWSVLREQDRDDNRNAADHIDYKLARAGLVAARAMEGATISDHEMEILSAIEHARWMAGKSISGVRYGPVRDNALLLHPDMKPYAALDEDAKRKDREQIAMVPVQLASSGEALARLRAVRILSLDGAQQALALLQNPAARSEQRPIVAVDLASETGISVAEMALSAGLPVEALVAQKKNAADDPRLRRRAAAILRRAWRIQIIPEQPEQGSFVAQYPVLVNAEGRIDATVLD